VTSRGKSERSLDLVEAAVRILRQIKPATVRAVCYRLFIERFIDSMAKTRTNSVSRQLVWAREARRIPWDWIVDETREAERAPTWQDPNTIIDAAVRGYRRDHWQDQPLRVECWSEKGTVRGTLAPVLEHYGVTLRVMHGYGSATILNSAAAETRASDKPLTVLYVGDWDPSGLHMSEVDLPSRLARYGGRATIRRVALSPEDVGPRTTLPSFDAATKQNDSRHQWFAERFGTRCWELDALSPVVLRERLKAEIASSLDLDAWTHALQIEGAEVQSMRDFHETYRRTISGQASK
jgi:hypothetical protein